MVSVGIDVGVPNRGFHLVALGGGEVEIFRTFEPSDATEWCVRQGATVVGVDSPCRWGVEGKSWGAERVLGEVGMSCFSAPTREVVLGHGKGFYGWVFEGNGFLRVWSGGIRFIGVGIGRGGVLRLFRMR